MTLLQNIRELSFKSLRAAFGLMLYSLSVYIMVQADIGLAPWDVFSMGLSLHLPVTFGQASILISVVIIAVDLIMKEEIGIGTFLDAVIVGVCIDFYTALGFVPHSSSMVLSVIMVVVSLFINAYALYFYMSARISCGPRDTFLVALGKRLRRIPIGAVSVFISLSVVVLGWLLGGSVGIGTVIASFGIGTAMQIVFKLCKFDPRSVKHEGIQGTINRFKKAKV